MLNLGLNGIRSSRRLERECKRNIELQWLIGKLVPNYHSISDFRKDNPQALQNTFKLFVLFLKDCDLLGGTTVAIDGTKMRANNSKKNNYSPKKIQRHLDYIEEKTKVYLQELDANDESESPIKIDGITKKIERLKTNKIRYELLAERLEQSGEPQISTTDGDARALLVQGQVVEVCYNMQAAVDNKHNLPVATHTINRNDRNALSAIAKEAKENLQVVSLMAISDKGYHNGKEIQTCNEHGIATICAQQEINEHIFGTIKRQWGYNHTNLRSLKKVNGEFALIMTVYNMKRSMNILGMETILEKIKNWKPNYKGMTLHLQKPSCFREISAHQNIEMKLAA